MRTFNSRATDIGRERARYLARRFGAELRVARVTRGMTQEQLASRAGVSQQEVSLAECGRHSVSLDVSCRLAAACGHELGLKLYPIGSVSLRDSGQLAIAQKIAAAVHPSWKAEVERPVAHGDPRAADLVFSSRVETWHVEIERSLVDVQAQIRSAQLKREVLAARDPRPTRLVIAVPDTRKSREVIASLDVILRRAFPVPSREIWHALRAGNPIGGDGILFVRERQRSGR